MFKKINPGKYLKSVSTWMGSVLRGGMKGGGSALQSGMKGARWSLNLIPRAGRGLFRAYLAAASKAYDLGRFNPHVPLSHATTVPHFYDEMHIPFVRDLPYLSRLAIDPTNLTVSIPFEMRGQKIPALKTSKVDACGRADFPRLLVTFRDIHPEFLGDETILIQPGGSASKVLRLDDPNLTWMVWQPRTIKIANMRREVSKTQAEIDALDIARELSRYAREGSNGAISVNPNTLLTALNIFTQYSEPLRARWKILTDRYAFMRHVTVRPHAVAALLRSIVEIPSEELAELIRDMESGQVQTWSAFLDAINAIPNVTAIAGGAAIAEQHGMRTSLYRDNRAMAEDIPPSIFVSALGLPYFLAYLDAREKRIEPDLKLLAEENAQVVAAMIQFHRRFAQVRLEAVEAGTAQLDARKGALIAANEQAVRELLDLQEQQFRGHLIMENPSRLIAGDKVPEGLPSGKS
ncbi:MAG: hypothetical protein WCF84_00115 [Anaerolineae bacterium]